MVSDSRALIHMVRRVPLIHLITRCSLLIKILVTRDGEFLTRVNSWQVRILNRIEFQFGIFTKHIKMPIMAEVWTLYSQRLAVFFIIWIDVRKCEIVKLWNQLVRGLHFKAADFIGFANFERHNQNEVGHIGILVLWRDCEKLYSCKLVSLFYSGK